MPLGTPQGPTASQWKVTATSQATLGDYGVQFDVIATTDNPDDPGVAPIVQAFIDLLANSPDFRVNNATRTYSYLEPITPTK
ncbi:hypothetical protein GCM10010294_67590 [Streptomyces griseoloalbus]|uniref:hypothetical protein n=1 Tax=Streptomyces griseoloalbus TaxID=67303 RepID=UPI00187403C1|nr:hypothetical protein GCM10010294_67590 [Streptomyces griseoloalbus]